MTDGYRASTGASDLSAMLADLRPVLAETEFAFATVPSMSDVPQGLTVFGTFREEEGFTLILPAGEAEGGNIRFRRGWAKISLSMHSSLEAVGLTASVASALAKAGLSANVVAAFYHDHIFVPWERRHEAMRVLASLSAA